MKGLSAHITGFYRSSFHAYTTEVNLDGHRWRLGLRYSKFRDFYDELMSKYKDFHAEFPPKGTLFFTPKPEERQEQLEIFLQQVFAFFAAKDYPIDMEDLLCNLLKVPRHLKHDDDDISTCTDSAHDEPMREPPSSVASIEEELSPRGNGMDQEAPKQILIEDVMVGSPTAKQEENDIASELLLPASPVDRELGPVEQTVSTETPLQLPVCADIVKDSVNDEVDDLTKEAGLQQMMEPVVSLNEESNGEVDELPAERHAVAENGDELEESESIGLEKQIAVEPVLLESMPSEMEAVEQPSFRKGDEMNEKDDEMKGKMEHQEVTTGVSWLAAYLPKSVLMFIRRRCMKKTNLVILVVALLLPMVFR